MLRMTLAVATMAVLRTCDRSSYLVSGAGGPDRDTVVGSFFMTSPFGKLCLLGLAVFSVILCAEAARAQQPPTLEEIVAGLERREKLFFESKSMFLRYERTKSTDLIPTKASGGLLPAEWTLAYRGDKWWNRRRFTQPSTVNGFVVPGEPKTGVAKNGAVLEWDASGKNAYIDRFGLGVNMFAGLYYTANLGLDAPRYMAKAGGAEKDLPKIRKECADDAGQPFLPEFLRTNVAQYRVLSEPEDVDGARCWVVEWPGMDRFCVAVEQGFAILQRKYCWGPDKPPQYEVRNSDFREVKPGLWLPFSQVVDRYASIVAEKESLWGKVASRSEYVVKTLEFDNVPDSLFDLEIPSGVLVYDAMRDFSYVVSGKDDSDPFSSPVTEGQRMLQNSSRRPMMIAVSLLLGLSVGCLVWRRRRKSLQL